MIHRTVIRFLSAALLAVPVVGCGDDDDLPTESGQPYVEITPLFQGILEGSTVQLTATLNGDPVAVTWESSNTAAATVSATGLVTGTGGGFAAITATPVSADAHKRSASITVTAPPTLTSGVPVTGIASAGARGSTQLWKIIVPAGTTNLRVTLSGGTGDVDVYVNGGTPPNLNTGDYECFSFNGGNNELCNVANPTAGTYYVLLDLWDPYTGVTMTATLTP